MNEERSRKVAALTESDVAALHQHYREKGFVQLQSGPLQEELKELRDLLQSAMQLEHATIPPYLTGLYSMKAEMPWNIVGIIRTIVVEEMLHLLLAANVLNAIGGQPNLTAPDFIPDYPSYLPHHIDDLIVNLEPFSPQFVQQGLAIERPKYVDPVRIVLGDPERMTIGEFYVLIESKLRSVVAQYGEAAVFTGNLKRQVQPDMFYYDGAGQPVPVVSLETAVKALQIITDQGEGMERTIWVGGDDSDNEVAHYFRFNELAVGRQYQSGDTYQSGPTGAVLSVPYDLAYSAAVNAKIAEYPAGSEVRTHAEAFNVAYGQLLQLLERAFTGEPSVLLQSVPHMYLLRNAAQSLFKNPFPAKEDSGLNAAPTFEYVPVLTGQVASTVSLTAHAGVHPGHPLKQA